MLERVVSCLDGDESRGQRPSHSIGGTVVRAAPAVGAGIEIEHVLPGEVFECLNSKGFHLIQVLVAHTPSHRFQSPAVQLCEENAEQRRFHVELDPEWPVAQQEEEGQVMENIGAKLEIPQGRQGGRNERALQYPRQRQHRQKFNGLASLRVAGGLAGFKKAVGHHQERN